MKRILRVGAALVGLLAVALAGFAFYVDRAGVPHSTPQRLELKIEASPERIARGRRLASMLCAGCHRDPLTGASAAST